MLGLFRGCRLARMSSGRYCVVRDLGLVKGGKGMRHHEVVLPLSLRERESGYVSGRPKVPSPRQARTCFKR